MIERRCRVTIGVPVFNGDRFLAETLDSLLNQTFSDFEIVISDNASTDRTNEICRAYAARDPRIRYYRSETNRGAAWNHNRVFELAQGEFFKWNSADDPCAPEFLARCVAALDDDASAVMAFPNVLVIDDYGDEVSAGVARTVPAEIASSSPLKRFRRNIQTDHPCFHIYSLIRSCVLRRTGLLGNYNDSDRVLLSHLSLFGHCILISDTLLFNRDHAGRFGRSFASRSREGTVWFDRSAAGRKSFPYWREFRGLWEVVLRGPLRWQGRLKCYGALLVWLRSHKGPLLDDLLFYPRRWVAHRFSRGKELAPPVRLTSLKPIESMSVTVILSTYNRCQDLARALDSIAASQMPDTASWEILVVDNNSTDQTRQVVDDFCRRYPGRFRYLFEPKPGKSYALNAGIANARGEIFTFVDDDVTVEPRWLRNLTAELQDGQWAGAGGRIFPADEFVAPRWLSWQHCGGLLCGSFDLGNHPSELGVENAPHGTNMAFRRMMFEKYGGFRTDLGFSPSGATPRLNEDTEFGRRLIKAGEHLRYEPLAVVYHPVPKDRINREYFLRRWFEYGRTSIVERGDHPDVCGIPWDYLSLMRRAVDMSAMSLRWMFARRACMRFFWRCMIWKQAGMMVELYRRLAGRATSETTLAH
jgi:glycosyltransferase involved in cell wall biosynthesis